MVYHYDFKLPLSNNALIYTLGIIGIFLNSSINPMFFIVGGYGFREKSCKVILKKTVNELLKPYCYVTLAIAILFPIIHYTQYHNWNSALRQTIRWTLAFLLGIHSNLSSPKSILGIEIAANWVVWYLLTMFIAYNILNLILKSKKIALQVVLVLLSALFGYTLSLFDFNYFCIPQGMIAVFYCYTGYILKKSNFLSNYHVLMISCLFIIPIAGLQIVFGEFNMAYNTYKYGLAEIIGTCCSGILMLIINLYVNRIDLKLFDYIREIGMYTYWILCIHSIELVCIPWSKIVKSMPNHPILAFVIELFAKVLIITSGCFLLKKIIFYKYKRRRLQLNEK